MNKHDTDTLLRDWAQRQETPDPAANAALAARISTELRRQRLAMLVEERQAQQANNGWLPRLAWAAAGACLMLAVIVAARLVAPAGSGAAPAVAESATDFNRYLRQTNASQPREVFNECARVFNGQFVGYADTGKNLELGLLNDRGSDELHTRPLVQVQYVLLQRRAGERDWQTTWRTTAVVRAQERLILPASKELADVTLQLWTLPVNGSGVMVDTELDLGGGAQHIAYSGSDFCVAQHPVQALAIRSGDTEYRLIISAETLKA